MKHQTFCEELVPIPETASIAEMKRRLCLVCEDGAGRQKRKGGEADGVGGDGTPKKKGKKSSKAVLPLPPAGPTVESRRCGDSIRVRQLEALMEAKLYVLGIPPLTFRCACYVDQINPAFHPFRREARTRPSRVPTKTRLRY